MFISQTEGEYTTIQCLREFVLIGYVHPVVLIVVCAYL